MEGIFKLEYLAQKGAQLRTVVSEKSSGVFIYVVISLKEIEVLIQLVGGKCVCII